MNRNRIAKVAAVSVGLAMVFGAASPVGAQTIAEIQAQINLLIAQLAALQGGTVTTGGGGGYNFTATLRQGSRGADVTALQQYLMGAGHSIPALTSGSAYGYFGTQTKTAVTAWQAANGLVADGIFGPNSRAKYSTVAGGTTTTVPSTTVPSGVITTPGVEGTITVTRAPSPASGTKVYEGESMKKVLGIEIEAKTSDMRVERIKLDLDETGDTATSDTAFYNKFADRIYILDGSTVLASADLNRSTVVEESNEISITLAGMSVVIPKGQKKVVTVALDAKASWDSAYDGDTWTVGVPVDGVRSIDGAGVNQYGPSTAFLNSITSAADLVDSATLTLSLNTNTPKATDVVCIAGADEDECDDLEVLRFNAKADKDDVTITDFVLDIVRAGNTSTATSSVAYLYDGSTLVGSATVAGTGAGTMTATFSDIDWVVAKDTTKTFTVKFDITDAGTAATTFVASFDTVGVTAENSRGDGITESGSADGETLSIRNVGLEVTLVGSPTITRGLTPPQAASSTDASLGSIATSTAEATFNLRLKAVGGDIKLGTNASTTGALVDNDGNGVSATGPSFKVYQGGTEVTVSMATNASTTGFTIPTSGTTADGTNTRLLAENASIELPVSFLFEGRTSAGAFISTGSYSVQLSQLNWVSSAGLQTSTFMDGLLDWRTSSVSMP